MTKQTRSFLKAKFETGDKPSSTNYGDWIDSFLLLGTSAGDPVSETIFGALTITTVKATLISAATINVDSLTPTTITTSALTVTGNVSAGTIETTTITASAGTFTSVVSANTFAGTTGNFTGTVSAGTVNASSAAFTGTVSAADLSVDTLSLVTLTASAANITALVSASGLNLTGAVSASAGNFTGIVTASAGMFIEVSADHITGLALGDLYLPAPGDDVTMTSANVWYPIEGSAQEITHEHGFTLTSASCKLTYDRTRSQQFFVNANISMTSDSSNVYTNWSIAHNDVEVTASEQDRKIATGSDSGSVALQALVTLAQNDTIRVQVKASAAGPTIQAKHMNIIILAAGETD